MTNKPNTDKTIEQIRDEEAKKFLIEYFGLTERHEYKWKSYEHSLAIFNAAFDAAIKLCEQRERDLVEHLKSKLDYHEQAYGLDIFPNSEKITSKSSIDEVAAQMGRHMIRVFRGYIDEALKHRGENESP